MEIRDSIRERLESVQSGSSEQFEPGNKIGGGNTVVEVDLVDDRTDSSSDMTFPNKLRSISSNDTSSYPNTRNNSMNVVDSSLFIR